MRATPDSERDGNCCANAGGTSATSSAGSACCRAGDTAADRISPSSDSRARKGVIDPDTRDDTPRTCRRHGRDERNQSALHSGRKCRTRLWRVDSQSACAHACKVWRSDSWCSNLGITSTENRCQRLRRDRLIPWIDVSGEGADEEDQIEEIDDFVGKLYAYLVSFTTEAANRTVRNAGEGNGLEAWRRLHSEYDPTSSMRRVAILQHFQNPPRCQRVEDLGSALEDWLSKKRQYEMFTERNGRPCQASDDSLVAAMFRLMPKSLEETSCSPIRTRASRSCLTDCWPTAARSSRSE